MDSVFSVDALSNWNLIKLTKFHILFKTVPIYYFINVERLTVSLFFLSYVTSHQFVICVELLSSRYRTSLNNACKRYTHCICIGLFVIYNKACSEMFCTIFMFHKTTYLSLFLSISIFKQSLFLSFLIDKNGEITEHNIL